MNATTAAAKVEIIETGAALQAKIGTGEISPIAVTRAQKIMDKNEIDFVPIAAEFSARLSDILEQARNTQTDKAVILQKTIELVMQMKGSGGIFGYALITKLADITLDFLERADDLDQDGLRIVEALHNTTTIVINRKMQGNGGSMGAAIEKELREACQRYFAKHKQR